MVHKNDILSGKVQSFGSDGEGVVRVEDCTFFVPYALPGEEISFRVLKIKGNTGYGKIEEIFTPSPRRRAPVCPVFKTCGGCCLQHAEYDLQTEFKREKVRGALKKIGGIEAEVLPVVPCSSPYEYRNKLQLPVGVDANGNAVLGFYAERSHRIVPIGRCALHPAWAERLMKAFKEYIAESGASAYDELTKKGLLRHLVAREIDGNYLVTVVATEKRLPKSDVLIKKLRGIFPECSAFINVNDKDTNVIFGDKFYPLCGAGHIDGVSEGIRYEAGAETFVQVNPEVREKLYRKALEECFANGANVVIDAYSGGGLLTAMAAKRAKRAYGVELNAEASACAEKLKEKNGLTNMINICGDVAEKLPEIMRKERAENTVLIVDPPRAGVARSVLYAILNSGIGRIVMISCNPATLSRDLGILTGNLREENGALIKSMEKIDAEENATAYVNENERNSRYFNIERIEPYDMFPQTKHVETLVCLSKKSEKHISIDVEFGESDGQISLKKLQEELNEQKPKKKTTYKDIQAYIEEKYGFKVHTAYIAEVKRDLGLPMYDAPNAVEELKRPRSHPTAEMSDAIKAALKHFEII
ncbi:MAG: 23S rRNA (uracil(1939)-C(5))-methyltransferase RlmD [Candidatus Borkfalkiaceae bacterium]|nr:23S rRNA (uracil(1939)-C(5))-methyltransferase RlmD [Clostridia bacterium]MDY6222987.1 23S rRNA (uracil(1939)-C(5))-methyltransferase RlmD [Christensenellaceae bacterium]